MSFSVKIRAKGTLRELQAYYDAIKPDEEERKRAGYKISLSKGFLGKRELVIDITADDFTAFRSTTNSILNVMAIVDKTIQAV